MHSPSLGHSAVKSLASSLVAELRSFKNLRVRFSAIPLLTHPRAEIRALA